MASYQETLESHDSSKGLFIIFLPSTLRQKSRFLQGKNNNILQLNLYFRYAENIRFFSRSPPIRAPAAQASEVVIFGYSGCRSHVPVAIGQRPIAAEAGAGHR